MKISGECTNCGDDLPITNRWTMPLLKAGEKRYYLGTFFKVRCNMSLHKKGVQNKPQFRKEFMAAIGKRQSLEIYQYEV